MDKQLVVKSNFLVEASYRLSAVEQKIILTLATKIKKTDKEFQKYFFNFGELAHFLGLKTNADYAYLREVTQNLLSKVLTLKKENSILQTHWLESVEYFENKASVALCFNPELKPFLIQLKNNFTKYQLKYTIQLKSLFSIRVYELLKQYENIGFRKFPLEELRDRLGIKKEEYPLYGNFKAKVLVVAQKELKAKTDLSFKFEEVKTGRKVTDIKFNIHTKNIEEQSEELDLASLPFGQGNLFSNAADESKESRDIKVLASMLPEKYQAKKTIEKLISSFLLKHDFDYVARNIRYANDNSNAIKPGSNLLKGSNYRNYLAKALKDDFGLAYQEDTELSKAKEHEAREKANQQEEAKRKEEEKINQERERASKARAYLDNLEKAEFKEIEAATILELDPRFQKMVQEKRISAQFTLNRAMEQFVIKHFLIEKTEKMPLQTSNIED